MAVRPKADPSLGWAYRPDEATRSALARGTAKLKEHPELGSDRPHEGGGMAKALKAERKLIEKSRPKPKRRKKMAKKTGKKKLAELAPISKAIKKLAKEKQEGKRMDKEFFKGSVKPEKKAKGKLIPLKAICADLEIDPKAARVKLRRLIATGKIDFHDQSQRWEFTQSQAKEIKEHLS